MNDTFQRGRGGPTTITEIHDSGPKWRAIVVICLGAALLLAVVITALVSVSALGLRERAALAIADNAAVTKTVQPYKTAFWLALWLGGAAVAAAGSVSLSVIFLARAWIALTDARAAHFALRTPPLITQPARSVHLQAGADRPLVRKDNHREYSK